MEDSFWRSLTLLEKDLRAHFKDLEVDIYEQSGEPVIEVSHLFQFRIDYYAIKRSNVSDLLEPLIVIINSLATIDNGDG